MLHLLMLLPLSHLPFHLVGEDYPRPIPLNIKTRCHLPHLEATTHLLLGQIPNALSVQHQRMYQKTSERGWIAFVASHWAQEEGIPLSLHRANHLFRSGSNLLHVHQKYISQLMSLNLTCKVHLYQPNFLILNLSVLVTLASVMGMSINCRLSLLSHLLHQWHPSLPLPVAAPDNGMQIDTGPCSVSPSSRPKPVDTLLPLRTSHLRSNSGGTHPTRGTILPTSSCHSQEKVVSSAWLTHHIVLHRHMDTLL